MDYDNNALAITETLSTKIDGVKTERVDILGKLIESIKVWIDDNEDTMKVEDIQWMFKFFNNPMVPSDLGASIFKGHPVFKKKMIIDVRFNNQIYDFLIKKNIITEPKILKEWNKI